MADNATKDRPTITVDVGEGETREIELPDGYLPENEVRDKWLPKSVAEQERERAVQRAVKEAKGNLSAELMNSDDFLERVLDLRGDELRERLDIPADRGPTEADIEKVRKRVHQQDVEPLKEKTATLEEENQRLKSSAVQGEVNRALREADVDPEYADLVALWLEKRSGYDGDHGPVALDDDGKPDFVLQDSGGHRAKSPTDLLMEVKKSGKHPGWFRGQSRPGAGYNDSGRGSEPEKKIADMSKDERIAFRKEHGLEAFQKKLAEERANR